MLLAALLCCVSCDRTSPKGAVAPLQLEARIVGHALEIVDDRESLVVRVAVRSKAEEPVTVYVVHPKGFQMMAGGGAFLDGKRLDIYETRLAEKFDIRPNEDIEISYVFRPKSPDELEHLVHNISDLKIEDGFVAWKDKAGFHSEPVWFDVSGKDGDLSE